jgi:hypothetical protein
MVKLTEPFEGTGALQLAKQTAKERNVKIRILVPTNSLIEQKATSLRRKYGDNPHTASCSPVAVLYLYKLSWNPLSLRNGRIVLGLSFHR